ncbi:MAG: 2OG-Fe(II) oxygenase [Actinomycetota bacterium]
MTITDTAAPDLLPGFRPGDAGRLAEDFRSAEPFPHVVIDDFVTDVGLADHLPDAGWDGWHHYEDDYQSGKRICSDIERIPGPLAAVIHRLQSPSFLAYLTDVTGIEKIVPDPYLEGGGLHVSRGGGRLTPHTDFHTYTRLDLFRQINLLLYLNPAYETGDGGTLGLFEDVDADPTVSIEPVFGRCVIFRTDDRSVHGIVDPVAPGKERKSIALYYYTAAESESYGGTATTMWRRHPDSSGVAKARLQAYRSLLFGSRALSWAAHKAHPHRMS